MKKIFPLVFALSCLVPAVRAADKEESPDWDARLTEVEGDVKVYLAGSDDEEGIEAEPGMPLSKGDRVKTGDNGRAEIAMAEDNALQLGSRSVLRFMGLRKQDTFLGLDFGHLVAKAKLLVRRRYRVRTPTSVTAVRGTEFGIEVVDDGEATPKTVIGVFDEGQVAVSGLDEAGGEERVLGAGEEMDVLLGGAPGEPRKLTFLKRREEHLRQLLARRDQRREQFKKYRRQNRERMRRKLEKKRDKIRQKRQDMREDIDKERRGMKGRGSQRLEDMRRKRDGMRQGMRDDKDKKRR
ncbi:MAG: FecR family protein [Elusimicrobiota bacterium]